MSEPLHPACVETTIWGGPPSYVCGPDCPRPAGPDPARDARVAKRRAADAARAGKALDALLSDEGAALYLAGWQNGYSAGQLAEVEERIADDVDPHAYRRSGTGAGWSLCWCGRERDAPIHSAGPVREREPGCHCTLSWIEAADGWRDQKRLPNPKCPIHHGA
jgi:hypothetical protein